VSPAGKSLGVRGDMDFLGSLPEATRARLLEQARRRHFERNAVVFRQGEPGGSVHLLQRGWLAVRVATSAGDMATLDLLSPGAVFGELSFLDTSDRNRSASVVAIEPSSTLEVPSAAFAEMCRRDGAAVAAVLVLMARREKRLTQRLVEALYVPVELRLVRRLVDLAARQAGSPDPPRSIPLTQDDLASLAGTSRETANRVLNRLEETGEIALHRGSLEVLDLAALERRAATGVSV
jgi:CRP/FNR family cyclic AMP-dependent transcriptional regulator